MNKQAVQTEQVENKQTFEEIVEDFRHFLQSIIGRVEKARLAWRERLTASFYYSDMFQFDVKELARGEAVEKECRKILVYLDDPNHPDKIHERLNNISETIDRMRLNFRVNIERSTCGIRNEIENSRLEAMHGFLFSPDGFSDSHRIERFCQEAIEAM